MTFLAQKQQQAKSNQEVTYTLDEYLNLCKVDPMAYASAAERMVKAIGEPEIIDTSKDSRLSRIFLNRTIKVYEPFKDFYGIEDHLERVVSYFTKASQGLQESKQILHLLGPVGSSKSTLAERLKMLMEQNPIYVLCDAKGNPSPVFESPLGLFDMINDGETIYSEYGIPRRALASIPSPWAVKRLQEMDGDLTQFKVRKMWPSRVKQIGVARTEPGDANSQDITTLIGKTDIRMLERFSQSDPDAYSFSGGLNRANQGMLELVEMFKMSGALLNPLLAATAEFTYAPSEAIGQLPWQGILLSHCNETEFAKFKADKRNEAFVDRTCVVKIPYTLRVTEEARIYEKMLRDSTLSKSPCAPHTLDMLARFSVLSRLEPAEQSTLYAKLRVVNGDNIRDSEPRAKSLQEYQTLATEDEGMHGISTRFAMKALASTFNYDATEIAADPVQLFFILEQAVKREQFPKDKEEFYLANIKDELATRYGKEIEKEISTAYVESYSEYGANIFDRYLLLADAWLENVDFKCPDTGQLLDRTVINEELSRTEKAAGIASPKDFRNEVVKFALRYRAANNGKNPSWTAYEKIKEAIESRVFSSLDDMLPIISFGSKQSTDLAAKHEQFLERMMTRGYTKRQVQRLVEWHLRTKRS